MRVRIDGVKSVRVVPGPTGEGGLLDYQWLEIEDATGAYISYFLTDKEADMLAEALDQFPGRRGCQSQPGAR